MEIKDKIIKTKWIFNATLSFKLILKYKNIIKMILNLMVFVLEIILKKNKGWGIYNKS